MVNYSDIIELIESQKNPKTIESMASLGINVTNAYGIKIPFLRSIAGQIGKGMGKTIIFWCSNYGHQEFMN